MTFFGKRFNDSRPNDIAQTAMVICNPVPEKFGHRLATGQRLFLAKDQWVIGRERTGQCACEVFRCLPPRAENQDRTEIREKCPRN